MRTLTSVLSLLNLTWVTWMAASGAFRSQDIIISWRAVLLGFLLWVGLIVLLAMMRKEGLRLEPTRYVVLRGSVKCPQCGFLVDRDDQHCGRCGEAVQQVRTRVRCSRCKGRNWDDDTFCRSCGAKLEDAIESDQPGRPAPSAGAPSSPPPASSEEPDKPVSG